MLETYLQILVCHVVFPIFLLIKIRIKIYQLKFVTFRRHLNAQSVNSCDKQGRGNLHFGHLGDLKVKK